MKLEDFKGSTVKTYRATSHYLKSTKNYWICFCEKCGKRKDIWAYYFKKNKVLACECQRPKKAKKGSAKGDRNGMWKGGVAEYKDHYAMKLNRKLAFDKYNNKCQRCFQKAEVIHHVDGSKDNHSLENLIPLCSKCHLKLHSKIYKAYGYTLKEMAKITGFSMGKCHYLCKNNPSFINQTLTGIE